MHRAPEPRATETSRLEISCGQGGYWAPHQASWWYSRPLHIGNRANDGSRLLLALKKILWINRQKRAKFWKSRVFKQCFPGIHHGIYWVTGTPLKSFVPLTLQQCSCTAQNWGVLTPLKLDTKQWQRSTTPWRARNWNCSAWKSTLPKIQALFTADRHSVEKPDRQKEFFQRSHCTSESERNWSSRKYFTMHLIFTAYFAQFWIHTNTQSRFF